MKRSIVVAGHKTSISLEEPFWRSLREIASAKEVTVAQLVALIDRDRRQGNLSSHIRLFVLGHYQTLAVRSDVLERIASSSAGTNP